MRRWIVPLLVVLVAGFLALPVLWTSTREGPAAPVEPSPASEITEHPRSDTTRRVRTPTPTNGDEEPVTLLKDRIPESEVFTEPPDVEIDWPRVRVTGRFVHADGTGAGRVVFEVRSTLGSWRELDDDESPASLVARGETDDQGRFEADVLVNRPLRVEARRKTPDRTGISVLHWSLVEYVDLVPDDWTIEAPARMFEICVRDAEGATVGGAHVTLRSAHSSAFEVVGKTDALGRIYCFRREADRITAVSPDGSEAGYARIESGAFEVVVVLGPVLRIDGTVVDAKDGEVIADADVAVGPPTWVRARSGDDGSFDLRVPRAEGQPAPRRIEVTADGYLPIRHFLGRAPGDEPIEIRMHRGTAAQFRLVDASGEPMPRARVVVEARSRIGFSTVGGRTAARTDDDGFVHFGALAPEVPEADVEVYVQGIRRHTRTIATGPAGTTSDLGTWVIGAEARIEGRVLQSDGSVAAGWRVAAARREEDSTSVLTDHLFEGSGVLSAFTAPDGTFTLRGGEAGLWDVVAWHPGRPMATARALSVTGEGATLELRSPAPAPIVGRVVDAENRPRVDVEVSILVDHPIDLNLIDTVVTDEDGRFRYEGFSSSTDRVWVEFATSEPDENGAHTVAGLYLRPGEETLIRADRLRAHDPDEHDRIRGR